MRRLQHQWRKDTENGRHQHLDSSITSERQSQTSPMDPLQQATDPAAVTAPAVTTTTPTDASTTPSPSTSTPPSTTSNGNQVAVLSTIDYSTHTMINYYSSTTVINHYDTAKTTSANGSGNSADGSSSLTSSSSEAAVHYRFKSSRYFSRTGSKQIDRIINFDGENGDKLELSRAAFKGLDKLDLAIVSTRQERREAAKTTADVIYQQSSGKLFFNANDALSGFGRDGGCFAILVGGPQINESHFILF